MAFSGQWLKQNGPYDAVSMQHVHTADPAHAAQSYDDPGVASYTTPEGTAQTGFGVPDAEWMGGTGVLLEYAPQEHDIGLGDHAHPSDPYIGGSGAGSGELTASQVAATVHGESYGADLEYTVAPMQFSTERYGAIRSSGLPATLTDSAPTGWRGTYGNSSPQNNPGGYRLGEDLMVVGVDRKFYVGQRFHDRHVVSPNDADAPTNQIRGTGPSPYLSPFDSARRAITRTWATPALAESPPDFSHDMLTAAQVDDTSPDWGFVG